MNLFMWKLNTKIEENFFDFAAERVWYIGTDGPQEPDEELEKLIKQISSTVEPQIWLRYETKISIYNDQTMYEAYKQGFIDALFLFITTKNNSI